MTKDRRDKKKEPAAQVAEPEVRIAELCAAYDLEEPPSNDDLERLMRYPGTPNEQEEDLRRISSRMERTSALMEDWHFVMLQEEVRCTQKYRELIISAKEDVGDNGRAPSDDMARYRAEADPTYVEAKARFHTAVRIRGRLYGAVMALRSKKDVLLAFFARTPQDD